MKAMFAFAGAVAVAVLTVVASGCSQPSATGAPVEDTTTSTSGGHGHSAHGTDGDHQGPHQGQIIELGRSHAFHAELVDDESNGTVSIFILDKDLKEFAIDARSVSLNLIVKGQPQRFELAAPSDGKSSVFTANDRALLEALHEHQATGKLRVSIDGDSYTGTVEAHPHHDAEGHDHGHHDGHGHHDEHDHGHHGDHGHSHSRAAWRDRPAG